MSKNEYLAQLRGLMEAAAISGIDERIDYYSEMIDDRIEAGMPEELAVSAMEDINEIVENARLEKPVTTLIKEKVVNSHNEAKKKGAGWLWVVLAIIGFPVWFPIAVAFFAILLALYLVLWSIVLAIFCVWLSLGCVALAGIAGFITSFFGAVSIFGGFMCLGAALFFGGLTVLLFKPIITLCKAVAGMIPAAFKKIKGMFA